MAYFNSSRVLAFKNDSTIAMSTGHFTKSLSLCCKSPSTPIFPLTTNRSILSFTTSEYSRDYPPQQVRYEHPYQTGGPGNVMSVDFVEDDALVRVMMPGVGEDGFKIWVENNTVFFEGEGEMELEADQDSRRTYRGGIGFEISQDIFEVKTKMKNGILMIRIPGLKNMIQHHL